MNFYNQKWVCWFHADGITLWPFIFYRRGSEHVGRWLRFHEEYHYKMQIRWLLLPRFVAYWLLYIIYGYIDHPFERAASKYADDKLRNI